MSGIEKTGYPALLDGIYRFAGANQIGTGLILNCRTRKLKNPAVLQRGFILPIENIQDYILGGLSEFGK